MNLRNAAMANEVVKVYYADSETGSAEVLSGRVARIVDAPVLNLKLCRGSIVLLARKPPNGGIPQIAKILYSPHQRRTLLYSADEGKVATLLRMLETTGAETCLAWPPKDGRPGALIVSHSDDIDPVKLASGVGIDQPDDDEDVLSKATGDDEDDEDADGGGIVEDI
jgi:hypothetical protein